MSDEYKCLRCGYVSDLKLNLIRHLKRKHTCSPNLSDVTCDELLTAFVVDKPYSCKNNCGKSFQTTAYLSQHMNKCNAVNIPRNDVKRMINEIKSLKEMILKKEQSTIPIIMPESCQTKDKVECEPAYITESTDNQTMTALSYYLPQHLNM
jgi:hypothetical protein